MSNTQDWKSNVREYIPTCDCADRADHKTILRNGVTVGITTQFRESGVFKNNQAVTLENRFCPQCGKPREIKMATGAQTLLPGLF